MKDKAKTKAQLLAEVAALRTRVAELEAAAAAKPIEQHPSQLETLRQIGLELTSELNLEVLLRSIVSRAVELLGGVTGSLFLYQPERDALEVVVALSGQKIGAILERGEGISGKIWETRQPVIVENYQTWPGRSAQFDGRDFTTAIGVPIQWGAEFLGVLIVVNRPTPFEQAEATLLGMLANQAAIAIRNTQLINSLQQSEARYRGLFEESPISLWEEDFSAVKVYLDELRAGGITDFAAYFEQHPVEIQRCADMVKVIDVNRATLKLYRLSHKKELQNLGQTLKPDELNYFKAELLAIANGEVRFKGENLTDLLLSQDKIFVNLSWSAAPGYEASYARVLVSLVDVTQRKQAEEESQQRLAQLEALRQVSLELTAELDLDTLLNSIVFHGVTLLKGTSGSLYLYRPEFDAVELILAVGTPLVPRGIILRRGEGMSGKILETHQPILIEDYHEWAGAARLFKNYSFNTAIAVPIQLGQEFLGTLNIANRPIPFSLADVELLSLFATQAAIAIRNARLLDSLQQSEHSYKTLFAIERRQAQQLYLLEQVRAALAGELDLPTILRTVVEVIAETFGYTQVGIYLLEGDVAVLQHQVGYNQTTARIPLTKDMCDQVVSSGQPSLIRNAGIPPDFREEPASEIYVPLFDQGQVVGFFSIQSSQGVTLDEADLRLMIALSEQINLAINRARLYNEAKESAERFRQLAENIHDVFWMTDLAGTETIYVSPAYEELWGRPLRSIYEQPRSWVEAVHPEDRTVVATQFVGRNRGQPALKEYRIVQPDGEIRWVRERSFPVLNESGEVYRVAGIIEDITQRRQTEEALRQSEERFRSLFEGSPISLWEEDFSAVKTYLDRLRDRGVTDFETYFEQYPEEVSYCGTLVKFIDSNQAALKLCQVNTKAELAILLQQIIQSVPESFKRELLTIAAGKTKLESEQFTRVVDGAETLHVIINWSVAPGYEENYAQVLVGVLDITNRKRAEQALLESEQRYRELAQQNATLYTESQKRLIEQTALLRATTAISSNLDLPTLLKSIAQQIGLAVDATSAYICSYDPETKNSEVMAEYFSPYASAAERVSDMGVIYHLPRDFPKTFAFLQSGEPTQFQHLADLEMYEAEKNHLQQFGALTALIIRLQVGTQLIGYVALWESRERRNFTADEVSLCQGIAQQAAIVIQNARLLEQARQDADTKAILLKEVNHRVKNNLTTIIGLLYAERRHQNNSGKPGDFSEIIQDLVNRVHGLSTVHSLLSATEWAPLALTELAYQIVTSTLQSLASDKHVEVKVLPSAVLVTPQQANNLALIINELTTNTIKYGLASDEPLQVIINVDQDDKVIRFEFRNSGPGYPPEVLNLERHNVGMYLIQSLVRKGLSGQINLHNEEGAVAIIRFPALLPAKGKI